MFLLCTRIADWSGEMPAQYERAPAGRSSAVHLHGAPRDVLLPAWTGPRSLAVPGAGRGVEVSGNSSRSSGLFIVGVGASAGGVEALEHLFRACRRRSAPRSSSSPTWARSVRRCSRKSSRVTCADAGRQRYPRSARGGEPRLRAAVRRGADDCEADAAICIPQQPISTNAIRSTFSSRRWPEPRGENAVGIVLSGAGSDGTLGVKAIKEEGGLTIAQGHDQSGPRTRACPRARSPRDWSTWWCPSRRSARSCRSISAASTS